VPFGAGLFDAIATTKRHDQIPFGTQIANRCLDVFEKIDGACNARLVVSIGSHEVAAVDCGSLCDSGRPLTSSARSQ